MYIFIRRKFKSYLLKIRLTICEFQSTFFTSPEKEVIFIWRLNLKYLPNFLSVCFYWKVEKWRHASFGQKPQKTFSFYFYTSGPNRSHGGWRCPCGGAVQLEYILIKCSCPRQRGSLPIVQFCTPIFPVFRLCFIIQIYFFFYCWPGKLQMQNDESNKHAAHLYAFRHR